MQYSPYVDIELNKEIQKKQYAYGESLAASLIVYAAHDSEFAEALAVLARALPISRARYNNISGIPYNISLMMPYGQESALRRANWLTRAILQDRIQGASHAARMLRTWERERTYEEPRAIVIGLIGLAIPFIDLGLLKRKKKSKLMVVIGEPYLKEKNTTAFLEKVNQASLRVLERGLEMAGYDARELEPEMGDWFFCEKALVWYRADDAALAHLRGELGDLNALYVPLCEDEKLVGLVISPTVDLNMCMARGIEMVE